MVKMPPKKAFFGQVNYMNRNVHDDLLELLRESTTKPAQVKRLTSLDPRLRIADGLYDKGNWVRDVMTMLTGLVLFKKCFHRGICLSRMLMSRILIWENW